MKAKTLAAAAAISIASAGFASADTVRIGITQNNVGVDSYQTTYEKAFLEAARANPNVEAVAGLFSSPPAGCLDRAKRVLMGRDAA
jgi:ribose transport system substrate-binding protein